MSGFTNNIIHDHHCSDMIAVFDFETDISIYNEPILYFMYLYNHLILINYYVYYCKMIEFKNYLSTHFKASRTYNI